MLSDKNGQPFFGPKGLLILAGLILFIAIKAINANHEVAATRRAEAMPVASDPLCIKQADDASVTACHAYWRAKGGCDPLGILPEGCPSMAKASAGQAAQSLPAQPSAR